MANITKLLRDDVGAVTVDLIALSVGVLILGITNIYMIYTTVVSVLVTDFNLNASALYSNVSPDAVVNE